MQEVLDFLKVSGGRAPSKHSSDKQETNLFYKLSRLKKSDAWPAFEVEYNRECAAHGRAQTKLPQSQSFETPTKRQQLDCGSAAGSATKRHAGTTDGPSRASAHDADTPVHSHRLSEAAAEKLAQSCRKSPGSRMGCSDEGHQGDVLSPWAHCASPVSSRDRSMSPLARPISSGKSAPPGE